jgi:hypothetical protein
MFAVVDQLCSARRTAPTTSLPSLMFAAGEFSDVESETMIGSRSQRCAPNAGDGVTSTDEARPGTIVTTSAATIVTMADTARII